MNWSTINLAASIDIDENPLYSLEAVIAEQYPDYTIQENIARYLKEIKTGGLNLFEIEMILIFLVIIRLVYYSVRYNPITSIKLCSIGAVSCYFWWVVLNDCVKGYYTSMECQSLLMRGPLIESNALAQKVARRTFHRAMSNLLALLQSFRSLIQMYNLEQLPLSI